MSRTTQPGYSALQILLHWVIAALVLFQLVFGESMSMVSRAARRGETAAASDITLASAHYWVGIAILVLVALRLVVRLTQGAPAPASDAGSLMARAATAGHILFYVLLVAVPVTGLLAVYVSNEFGEIHELGKPAFIILIVVHAAAALFHQFWLKDGTLRRMFVPAR